MPEPIANSPNQVPDRTRVAPPGTGTEGRAPEEPEAAALSRRGIAGDRCGDLQRHRQEDACSEGSKFASAAPADAPGQHRQQRAGSQKPGRRSATEGGATGCEFVAVARPLARKWDAGAASRSSVPTAQRVSQRLAFPASRAHNRANTRSSSFPRQPRRNSSSPPKTVNSPMTLASPRISSTRASPILRHSNNGAVPAEDVGTSGRVRSAGAYGAAPGQTASTLIAPRAAGDPPATPAAQTAAERKPEVNIDASHGPALRDL